MTAGGFNPAMLAVFAAALFAIVVVFAVASAFSGGDRRRMKSRLARVTGRPVARRRAIAGAADEQFASLRRDQSSERMRMLDAIARRVLPRPQALRDRLAKTGRRITIGHYMLACFGIDLVLSLMRSVLFDMAPALAILLGLVAGLGIPHLTVSAMIRRRLKRFNAQFPEAIDLIVRGLKSGLPTQESIRVVGAEFGDPIGVEFRRISDSVRIGQTLDDALWDTAKRLDTAEFRFFCICLSVQRETGGNLGETLENLSEILRRRRQMHLKIKAMSSEAKASAIILGSLPFVMFGLLFLVNRGYVLQLFTDPRGLVLVGLGLGSLVTGVVVMMKMVRFEI